MKIPTLITLFAASLLSHAEPASLFNGKEVMTYASETAKEKGPVGLQVHPGKEMKVLFRDLTLGAL